MVLPWGSGCAGRTLTATAPWLGSTLGSTSSGPAGQALAGNASFGLTLAADLAALQRAVAAGTAGAEFAASAAAMAAAD